MPVSKHRYKRKGKKPQNKNMRVMSKLADGYENVEAHPLLGSALFLQVDNSRFNNDEDMKRLASRYKADKEKFLQEVKKPGSRLKGYIDKKMDEWEEHGQLTLHKVIMNYYEEYPKVYGKTRDQLLGMNIIDIRNSYKMVQSNPEVYSEEAFNKFLDTCGHFYSMIPCFTSGVLLYEDNRYIEWRILKIDEEQKVLDIYLMHYLDHDGVWEPGISTSISIEMYHDDLGPAHLIHLSDVNSMDYSEIYRIIPISDFGWTETEAIVFKKMVLNHADKVKEVLGNKDTSTLRAMATDFLTYMTQFNFILSIRKSKTHRKRKPSESHIEWRDDPNPKRRIHYVGILPVKSDKRPVPVTRDSIKKVMTSEVRYKVPAWECRGFYRHLKNGTVQYVHPHIKHRRNYNKDLLKESTPPHTLIVRDPGDISCEEDNTDT